MGGRKIQWGKEEYKVKEGELEKKECIVKKKFECAQIDWEHAIVVIRLHFHCDWFAYMEAPRGEEDNS